MTPGSRTKDGTTAYPQRRTDGTSTSTAGAFLFPGFSATAADQTTGLGCMSALTFVGLLHNNSLMDNCFVEFYAKDVIHQFYFFTGLFAGHIVNCYFRH